MQPRLLCTVTTIHHNDVPQAGAPGATKQRKRNIHNNMQPTGHILHGSIDLQAATRINHSLVISRE
eukprot:1824999-Amphidinium_carterae.1